MERLVACLRGCGLEIHRRTLWQHARGEEQPTRAAARHRRRLLVGDAKPEAARACVSSKSSKRKRDGGG